MKTEKMSFKNIKDVLSRDEMKGIMAGEMYYYSCTCGNGTGYGCGGDRSDQIACSNFFCNGTGSNCYPS